MKRRTKGGALLQATSTLAMLGILVGGVTFAALRSQTNYITGSRLTAASANLTMAKVNNGVWLTSMAGYEFLNVVPGGAAGPTLGNDLFLNNAGVMPLKLTMAIDGDKLINSNAVSLDKAYLVIVDNGNNIVSTTSLFPMITAYENNSTVPLNIVLPAKTVSHFRLMIQLDADVIDDTTEQGMAQNMDFILSGEAVTG